MNLRTTLSLALAPLCVAMCSQAPAYAIVVPHPVVVSHVVNVTPELAGGWNGFAYNFFSEFWNDLE